MIVHSFGCAWFALILCASAHAQDAEPSGARRISFDDGSGESLWKVSGPSGPSDWFNVDFDGALDDVLLLQLHCDSSETLSIAGRHASVGVYPEDVAFPNAPDLAAPVVVRSPVEVFASDGVGTDSAYLVPKTRVPVGDHHVALEFVAGDSHTWCASDTNGSPNGRSFFSAGGYSTGAVPFSLANWMLAAGVYDVTVPGTLLINGATSTRVEQDGGALCLTFFGPTLNTASVLYFCVGGSPSFQLIPASFTVTDGVFAGPCPMTWQLCSTFDCNTPTVSGAELCVVYFDHSDLRPNGRPKTKVGPSASLDVIASRSCLPPGGVGDCFGQRDDCVMDSTIWKVGNPAGPAHWFHVNHGTTATSSMQVQQLTGVSVSAWDFCGFGPCWADVGIYPTNTAVGVGCTPDVSKPITAARGTSACVPPGAGDWGCPLTFIDVPDVPADTTTTYHAAVHWPSGDTCLWIGSDTDGTDGACGDPLPSNGCLSLFTSSGYASPAVPFTAAHWMIRIDWQ